MTRPKELSSELWDVLGGYQNEGLIPSGWEPLGDSPREHRGSIEAKAYATWLLRNAASCASRHPETCRSMFSMRHDTNYTTPPADIPESAWIPPAQGFVIPRDILPKGDAWEAEEPQPAEDVPPPPEV